MRTAVYVDGFNLYNRALDKTPFKWLDLKRLSQNILKAENQIVVIRYYTARVTGRRDPDQPNRQNIYLRALETIPELTIYFGKFYDKQITRPLVQPVPGLPRFVEVHTTEEKGSDVNLASHLVRDAFQNVFDVAVVVSKDTDLIEPIRIVAKEVGKLAGVICPDGQCPDGLKKEASFVRHIRKSDLQRSQFPPSITFADGSRIHKPPTW